MQMPFRMRTNTSRPSRPKKQISMQIFLWVHPSCYNYI